MTIEPQPVQSIVDDVINRFARDARKHPRVDEIPESATHALHQLAAEVYAMGYADGVNVESNRQYNERRRDADRAEHAAEEAHRDAVRDREIAGVEERHGGPF
ncbi:hypothetical protein SEA_TARDUS_65 [Gordonia phage Tardus]|uniref:Uncharacterized protein n=1 Tax=Gordonia phage Tardus TaxID=2939734 RepID=A0A9E7E579_9CAUD|nr:hypothetical protein SEA_TARDUS_65 [Gordonia phage Tardus]